MAEPGKEGVVSTRKRIASAVGATLLVSAVTLSLLHLVTRSGETGAVPTDPGWVADGTVVSTGYPPEWTRHRIRQLQSLLASHSAPYGRD